MKEKVLSMLGILALLCGLMTCLNTSEVYAAGKLKKDSDGTYRYYNGSYVDYNYKGLVPYGKSLWYVQNGEIDYDEVTMVKYQGTWYVVRNGRVDTSFTGVFQYDDNVVYDIKNGVKTGRHTLSKSFKKLAAYLMENGEKDGTEYSITDVHEFGDGSRHMAVIKYNSSTKKIELMAGTAENGAVSGMVYTMSDVSMTDISAAIVYKDVDAEKYCGVVWEDGYSYSEQLDYYTNNMKYNSDTQNFVNRQMILAVDHWIYLLNVNGFHGAAARMTLYDPG